MKLRLGEKQHEAVRIPGLRDETFEATVGDSVLATKGVPHTFGNARPGQPARYLLVMTPRIQALISALHAQGADDPARSFAAHDSELFR